MTPDEKIQYWLDIADYDLATAEAMYRTKRWLYVAFMCHQVIEKTLKAYWNGTQTEDPPYTHNHARLASGCGGLFHTLTPLACKEMIDETKQLQSWIKDELSAATKPSGSSDAISK